MSSNLPGHNWSMISPHVYAIPRYVYQDSELVFKDAKKWFAFAKPTDATAGLPGTTPDDLLAIISHHLRQLNRHQPSRRLERILNHLDAAAHLMAANTQKPNP